MLAFANNPARRDRLAELLGQAMGQRVHVVVNAPPVGEGADDDSPGSSDSAGARGGGGAVRRAALELPLVQDVLDAFPDAAIMDARDDDAEQPPAPSAQPCDARDTVHEDEDGN